MKAVDVLITIFISLLCMSSGDATIWYVHPDSTLN
jgi:hypothetical protein